jgi:hypothetical protein
VTVFAVNDEPLAFLHHEPHGRIIMTGIIVQAYATEPGESAEAADIDAMFMFEEKGVWYTG